MKKIYILFLMSFLFSSCATFQITIMDDTGKIIETHKTANIYVGVGSTVPDIVCDAVLLAPSLFYPFPYLESSDRNFLGGLGLARYLRNTIGFGGRIFPSSLIKWVSFTDETGKNMTITGFNYKIEKTKLTIE